MRAPAPYIPVDQTANTDHLPFNERGPEPERYIPEPGDRFRWIEDDGWASDIFLAIDPGLLRVGTLYQRLRNGDAILAVEPETYHLVWFDARDQPDWGTPTQFVKVDFS